MKAAPALSCSVCRRTIGKRHSHHLTEGDRVLCSRCMDDPQMHSRVFPDCPVRWHDMYDHAGSVGTRAGVAAHLGLWP